MTWLNPLALFGVLTLGIPILIHLFGRRLAPRLRFPSLRLLGEGKPTPATRSVPSDLLLLVVRCAVLLAAVIALAQPVWPTANRRRDAQRPVRVILVDTSESMRRLTSRGRGLDLARSLGRTLLDSARGGIVVESTDPGGSLAGAASWLDAHGGRREVVVISDFQSGSVHEGQVASISDGIGLRFERIDSLGGLLPFTGPLAGIDSLWADSSGTFVQWRANRVDSLTWPALVASSEEMTHLRHAADGVRSLFTRALRPSDRVAVVFPGSSLRRQLATGAEPLDSVWQGDLLLQLRRDQTLAEVMRTATVVSACELPGTPAVSNAAGAPMASIASGGVGKLYDLLVFTCADAGSLASMALLAGVASGLDSVPPLTEREPVRLPDELLQRWHREPTVAPPNGTDQTSPYGRWFWVAGLLLLGIEEWLRRRAPRRSAASNQEAVSTRAA
jgi:hypothetical protein